MKDKRNCGMNYPVYQAPMMPPMNPNMGYPINMGYPTYPNYPGNVTSNTIEQQLNSLEQQINLLDRRVSRLEGANSNASSNYNKYNDSNYYMV